MPIRRRNPSQVLRHRLSPREQRVKYIIGCDMSLRQSGISVHDNTNRRIRFFTIDTREGLSDHTSVDQITEKFFEELEPFLTFDLCRDKATVFFFEDLYAQSGGRAGKGRMAARIESMGVIKHRLREASLRLYGVTPSAAVSHLVGKVPRNRADKKQAVMDWLHVNRNFYTKNDNIADAESLAEFGYSFLIEGKRLSARALYSSLG